MKFTLCVLLALSFLSHSGADKRIFCYFTNWAQYRQAEWAFRPEHLDPHICTHYIYAFAVVHPSTYKIKPYEWNDEDQDWKQSGMYSAFMKKVRQGNGKALLAVGGWNFGMRIATIMMADPAKRFNFINSTIHLLKKYDFDGVDVDFEYPNNQDTGGRPADKSNFLILLKEIRDAFNIELLKTGRAYLLTAAVAPLSNRANRAYTPGQLEKYVDYISIMAYDMHGAWERTIGFNAPLKSSQNTSSPFHDWSLESSIEYWIFDQKFPRDRINIGLALYGRSFKLDKSDSGPIIPYYSRNRGPGTAGPGTREPGVLGFVEIMTKSAASPHSRRSFDWSRYVPCVTDGDEWVTYDDLASLSLKVHFAKCYGLGGLMFWALDFDDFDGRLGIQVDGSSKNPLIRNCRRLFLSEPIDSRVCGFG